MVIGIMVLVLMLPAIIGAILRLACRTTHIDSLSISVGVLLAIIQAGFASEHAGPASLVNMMQGKNLSEGTINALVVAAIVFQIAFYAAVASFGIKLTDKLMGSRGSPE
jgi:multisubunit Na+/H+ antiporter MnhC subunit